MGRKKRRLRPVVFRLMAIFPFARTTVSTFPSFLGKCGLGRHLIYKPRRSSILSEASGQSPNRPASIAREVALLLDQHSGPLVLYARQLCADPEDAVQCAFVKLIQQRSLPKDCGAWLYRVVRNEALMQSRGERRRRDREQQFAALRGSWFEPELPGSLHGATASEALERLSQTQREIVVARIWGGLTFREIAELLDASQSSIHREYQQAIEFLQSELNQPCPSRTNPKT